MEFIYFYVWSTCLCAVVYCNVMQWSATKWYKCPHAHDCHILLEDKEAKCSHSTMSSHFLPQWRCVSVVVFTDSNWTNFYIWHKIFPSPLVDEWSSARETKTAVGQFQSISCLHRTKEQKELVLLCSSHQPHSRMQLHKVSNWVLLSQDDGSGFNAAHAVGIIKVSYKITIIMLKVRDSNDMCYQTGRFRLMGRRSFGAWTGEPMCFFFPGIRPSAPSYITNQGLQCSLEDKCRSQDQ